MNPGGGETRGAARATRQPRGPRPGPPARGGPRGAGRAPRVRGVAGARLAPGPPARLEELHTGGALALIEAGVALGESDTLVGELRAMIAADPVAERPRGLLMRALYAAGRQAEALTEYTQARELFASGPGVAPPPPLEHLYPRVLRQAPPGATPL